ncbi:Diadenosine 5',5'''-P1,P4-tetraphosphate phosphorylase 2 [Cytospora mali]|uniref:Diadenosine 5',5'''-P1,P4-tetraphosphate phosphorylase 2 n=1 Tax=Cytospora mali TaxID=578113 RepID=A0A194VN51_CYTMA|nr:Diadenosine 5',5'''-P1,P4-tetraphosphate phosphorylase 2 [Valsa mali]
MSPNRFEAPAKLPELVKSRFNTAKANGDINFYPTQVAVLTPAAVPFQLRFSPSLASKPKAPLAPLPSATEPPMKPFNPFEKPPPASIIGTVGDGHTLILNKFAIVPEHFLIITNSFKKQTNLLEGGDLKATHACIQAYHGEGKELFAFFNSGGHSGASQPHRHLQLLPVERMRDGLEGEGGGGGGGGGGAWGVLAEKLAAAEEEDTGDKVSKESVSLPFRTFSERLTEGMTPLALRSVYLRLYRKACAAVGSAVAEADGRDVSSLEDEKAEVEAKISYNLAMTRDAMVICPRVAEGDVVRDGEGKEVGRLALNGTVLAGTALVKSQEEWDALRGDSGRQLWRILGGIGVRAGDGVGCGGE